ncbi:putative transferase [Helianthus annuus]|uniref:Transferase n=1 Tax=Helianthus annuus TaxID=4232 RepID=A0A9K3NSS5_HELAN|nr:O-acyltransferase WSD1-like isoform X2 [Helianthus annuus]KAF5811504.1 putative transferase [Helianthus annuus]KAJ0932611.1 putative transferase [Helianthus annuus]
MESLTKELRCRKSALKPIQITKRNNITNHNGTDDGIASDEEEPLSPAARLFHEPNFNIYIIAILAFKNPIDVRVVYEKLPQTLLKHPRFSSLQVVDDKNGGIMKWVPTNVNLDNHIIIPNIPQTLETPDKFLEEYLYNLSKTSIDSSQPMWDLHLLNLKTSDETEAMGILRVHHSLGDGTSLMSLLLACTRQTSNPDAVPTVPTNKASKAGWFSSYSYRGGGPWWQRCFMTFCMVWWLVWNTLVDVGHFMATALFLEDTETPIKAPVGVELNPKRFAYRTVSLDDMKLIKNAMNVTINDVAIGVTQAGLSQYLNRRYGEGQKDEGATEKKNNLPKKKIRLRSTLLINIRPSSGIQALADMMEKNTEAKWGNWIGFVILPLTVGIRDDPLDYVRDAKATTERKKHSLEALYSFSVASMVLKLFHIKAANTPLTHTTLGFSNLVGPQEEIGFYGHVIDFIAPSCYGHPHGLMINFQSCVNKMTIVLSVDENTIPDPQRLLDDFEASLKLMKEAVYAKALAQGRGGHA